MGLPVCGSGEVRTALATRLKFLGPATIFGSRHPGRDRDDIPVLSHADAAAHGDWIVNALHGEDAMATLVPLDRAAPPLPPFPFPFPLPLPLPPAPPSPPAPP